MHILLFFQQIRLKVNLSFLAIDHCWLYRVLVPNPPHASTPGPKFFIKSKQRTNTIPVSKIADSVPWLPHQKPSIHSLHSCLSSLFLMRWTPPFSQPFSLSLALFILPSHQLQMWFSLLMWILFIHQPSFYNCVVTHPTLIFMCQHHSALVEHHQITSCAYWKYLIWQHVWTFPCTVWI